MNAKKKGFTLVELLVVIAILAVLSTIAILGYSSFIKKANVSNDRAVVEQMNKALLAYETIDEKARYCDEAVDQCISEGFILENLTPSTDGYHFAYDKANNRFMILNESFNFEFGTDGHTNVDLEPWNIFVVVASQAEIDNAFKNIEDEIRYFSIYTRQDFAFDNEDNEISVKAGFDAGKCENIKVVKYQNDIEQTIDINTNSYKTTLSIDAPNDTINHYGKVGYVNVIAVADHSYIEYGDGEVVQISEGHIIITDKSDIKKIHISINEDTDIFEDITITVRNGAQLPEMSRDSIEIKDGEEIKVCTVETSDKVESVYLTKEGIVEQVKLVSDTETRYVEYVEEPLSAEDKQNAVGIMLANELEGFSRNENGELEACTISSKNENGEIISEVEITFDYNTREFVISQKSGETLSNEELKQILDDRVIDTGIETSKSKKNAQLTDTWDGRVDVSWYDDEKDEFEINTAEQLAGLANLVNNGNTFEGKTIKLGCNIDLKTDEENPREWEQIGKVTHGYIAVAPFMGIFDGQNNTISNIYQNCYDDNGHDGNYGYGLFGCVKAATIKNLVIKDAWYGSETENIYGGFGFGGFVGIAFGNCTFDSLTLKSSYLCAYNCNCGGIVGGCTSGNMTFNNISVDRTNVLTTWNWGCWSGCDSQIGGIIGTVDIQDNCPDEAHKNVNGLYTTHISIKNCYIACQLMQMSDVCSNYWWYQYRSSGMLIGGFTHNKLDGLWNNTDNISNEALKSILSCKNVQVIYDTWNHQMYCFGEGLGRSGGEGFSRIDDVSTHSHDENMIDVCIVFDQLIGGWSGGSWRYETGNDFEAYTGVVITYLNNSQPEAE